MVSVGKNATSYLYNVALGKRLTYIESSDSPRPVCIVHTGVHWHKYILVGFRFSPVRRV